MVAKKPVFCSVCNGNLSESYVGQTFELYGATKDFYFEHATHIGFSVWNGSTKTIDKKLVLQRFVQCKEGHSCTSVGTKHSRICKVRMISETSTRCDAFLTINYMNDSEEWIIGLVNIIHNHPLVMPSKRRYLRTNREIPTRARELFLSLKASNVPSSKKFENALANFGGYANMPFC